MTTKTKNAMAVAKHRKERSKSGFVRVEVWTLPKWVERRAERPVWFEHVVILHFGD